LFFLVSAASLAADRSSNGPAIDVDLRQVGSLRDVRGSRRTLLDFKNNRAVVLAFLGSECPLANLYVPRLIKFEKQYRSKGVQFVAVYSNEHESLDEIAAHAFDRDIPFPVLKDFGQELADAVGVKRTPTVVVLGKDYVVRYLGSIDDQYGIAFRRQQPKQTYLKNALEAVLSGKKVAEKRIESDGCLLDRANTVKRPPRQVTYSKHIAAILQKPCQGCHRKGQIGPFSLMTYSDAVRRSAMIKEVVSQRRMPPWHADARYGKFENDRSMTQQEINTVVAWIENGMDRGHDRDLPPALQWAEGWAIGKPDVVLQMPKRFDVPADGVLSYKYFAVPTGFDEDRWVQAAEVNPGDPSVVHHVLVYVKRPGKRLYEIDGSTTALVGWAPGDNPTICPPNVAMLIPKGASLLFEVHYTPNGKATTDRTSVGLIFAKKPPARVEHRNIFANMRFRIPPGDPHYRAESTFTFRADARILALLPHMHYRGKSWRYVLIYPDGREENILSVPRWDFNWQTNYNFAEPLRVPKGTKLRATAYWDNSRNNPLNPDPSATVRYGLQSWEEMMNGWISYVSEEKLPQ
jgi:thiol-disulfide isomerase/thioredoxin